MQNISLNYDVNCFEKLFIEKSIESLFKNTIDSYRLRLNNPKTLIQELINVIQSSLDGVLTNNDYVKYTSSELKNILNGNNDELRFIDISKAHFINILGDIGKRNYKLLVQSCKIILKNNQDYYSNLFDKIISIFNSCNEFYDNNIFIQSKLKEFESNKKEIIVLTDFLFIELINKGFSKQYLYKIFQSLFVHGANQETFQEKITAFKTISNKLDENFSIIFLISDNSFQFDELKKIDENYTLVNKKYRNIKKNIFSDEVNIFLEKYKMNVLFSLDFNSKDYFKAIQYGVDKLSKDLDIYHFGYSKKHFKIDSQCATIAENNPQKGAINPSNFQIDGYFKSDSGVFTELLTKIELLKNRNIEKESFDKLISAIRYYRTGSESPELETKLLNYWIGLEFIFTSFNSEEKTIDRIRNYFSKCHSLIYIKRNLSDYHKTLERLGVSDKISNYTSDLSYLLVHSNYDLIINNTDSELLKFRTLFLKKWFEEPNKISEALKKHGDNLVWNITRLYRIRNEIVHNAAIKNGIYTHISHLKYYLSFTLNSILSFMSESDVDTDNDGNISIEDFFLSQEIILGSLKNEKLEEYLKVVNPNAIFH